MLRLLKKIWNGIKKLFQREPVTATASVAAVPVLAISAKRIALSLGTSPAALVFVVVLITISALGRMVWNYRNE